MKDINGNQIQIDFNAITPPSPSYIKRGTEGALRGNEGELTNEEMEILRLLQRGKQNVIKEKALAAATGLQGVEVREKIRHLIMEHDVLIGSCSHGFFIVETEEETREATRSLRHRGISILARASKLQRISLDEIYHQARIEFTGGE